MPIRVDDMPAARALAGTDKLLVDQGDQSADFGTGKVSLDELGSFLAGGGALGSLHFVDDFNDGASAWGVSTVLGASAKSVASGTAFGMPSSGLVVLAADVTAGSKASVIRRKTGLTLGPSSPIVIRWRFLIAGRPPDASICSMSMGVESVSNAGVDVAIAFDITNTTITPSLLTLTPGLNIEPFSLPTGTYFDARLTITETGTLVEIAADDGPYATVLAGAVAPAHSVYVPRASIGRGTGSGSGQLAIDLVEITANRAPPDAGTPTIDDSSSFEGLSYNPSVLADWSGTPPTDVRNALDRIAAKITPIP